MATPEHDDEPGLLDAIDFRAFFETVRLRWWVVPVVMAVTVGFLVAQETRLRTQPQEYLVSRSYQLPNPKAVLATVGLNPGIIEEFPDTVSQLLLLRGEDVRRQISAELGKDIEVQIPAVYEIPFVFQCRQPVIEDCERAIEAYAAKSGQIRYDAIIAGLETLRDVYLGVDASTEDASAPVKIAAIEALMKNLDTTLTQIDSFDQPLGATVDSVRRSKYVFGLAAGLLISLLILLQLTYTDSRIRSVRQLVRMVKGTSYLGAISARPHEVADRRAALALYHCMSSTSANRVRYVPLRKSPSDDSRLRRLTDLTGKTWTMATPFADMSVSELAVSTPGEVDVLVVQRNRDLRKDLSEALAASQSSDRHLAGVLLFD
jgi:hypothetical protein